MKTILLVASIVALAVYTMAGFGMFTLDRPAGWLGLGLVLLVASFFV